MTHKDRRRKRDRNGRLYDPRKKRDAGKQAHENRFQTMLRRRKWHVQGWMGRLKDMLMFWR
ncbi:hypothetical protein G9464_20920 [Halostella sp. JP-L12]|uniref:hypothetical protein n=1 Tax=Halostella TaxID=1843185 RepID=UPI000EF81EF9|nr:MULTISPECIES: hypothetical protein [Halostella]NHN50035.1 hypothetical protein [Halostella sp. JP-L12]